MPDIGIEQAVFLRAYGEAPRLVARSPGFADEWLPQLEMLLTDFGERPAGVACPEAVFAQPLGTSHVAVVQVADRPSGGGPELGFRVLVLPAAPYRDFFADPFAVAERFPPVWEGVLPGLTLPAAPLPPRTVADVRQVLKRVKAAALAEGQDPEAVELTPETAESPALLGGVQVLVDGGKLVFVRPAPDPGLIRGLWTLLPHANRRALWPATFAFGNALGFDALVVPRPGGDDYTGYTTEEQAADYPAGRYELALQTAAEAGDQRALDALFGRRGTRETLRLAVVLLVAVSLAVLLFRALPTPEPEQTPAPKDSPTWSPEQRERAANAAAMAGVANPWAAAGLASFGQWRRTERVATAAAIVASADPWAAAIQIRAAQARYAEVWKPVSP
jgi:hypothetical protein